MNLFTHAADILDPPENPYLYNPVGFITEKLGESLWSKQEETANSVMVHRRTAVHSAHDTGKSFIASRLVAWWLETHPPGEAFVVTTAPTGAQVKAILWREINKAHKKGGLVGRVNLTEWYIGGELVGIGRKPNDYEPTAFQGIHARYVLVVIDEACGVPKAIWEAVDTLITNEECRILAIGNPDDPTSEFAAVCRPNTDWNVIHIDGLESPNLSGEPIADHLRPYLLSKTWVDEKRRKWGEEAPMWMSKVRGLFPESSTDTVIPLSWCRRAVERVLEVGHPRRLAVDVARFGSNETVIGLREGPVFKILDRNQGHDTQETAGRAKRRAIELGITEPINVDGVGVGGGVVDQLKAEKVLVNDMNAGAAPYDRETYVNARAEWFWELRLRFEEGDIDIEDDDDLVAQLSSIKYRIDGRGRIVIESKDEMVKRGLESPDLADTISMAFAPDPPSIGLDATPVSV